MSEPDTRGLMRELQLIEQQYAAQAHKMDAYV